MISGIFEKIITAYVGDYIMDFDKNKFSVGITNGTINLEDIFINCERLSNLNLPFKIKLGKIGKLKMIVPWSNFNEPTQVNIEGLQLLISNSNQETWDFPDYFGFNSKLANLSNFANDILKNFEDKYSKAKTDKAFSMTEGIIIKILNKLKINLKNFHIRFEEHENSKQNISIGITLEEFSMVNATSNFDEINESNKNYAIDKNVYKLLMGTSFGIYFNSNETTLISLIETSQEMSKTMDSLFNVSTEKMVNANYLISPVNMIMRIKTNDYSSIFEKTVWNIYLSFNIENLNFELAKKNFDSIIFLINHFTNYSRFKFNYQDTSKFLFYKPRNRILDKDTQKFLKQPNIKNLNAVWWWKYAIRMVSKRIKFIRGKLNEFDINSYIMTSWQKDFETLFTKHMKNPSSLNVEEKVNLLKIITRTDIYILYEWTRNCIKDINLIKQQEKKESEKKGIMGGLFGGFFAKKPNKDEVLISKDEEEKINKIFEESFKGQLSILKKEITNINFLLEFKINNGSIRLLNQIEEESKTSEGIELIFTNFVIKFNKEIENYNIDCLVQSTNINHISYVNTTEKSIIPVSFLSEEPDQATNLFHAFLKINPSDEECNSNLSININSINFIYNQNLTEMLQRFIKINISEHFVNLSIDTWSSLKEKASSSISKAMRNKNIVNILIEARKILIPLRRDDYKNSELMCLDLGSQKFKLQYSGKIKKFNYKHFNSLSDFNSNFINQCVLSQPGFTFILSLLSSSQKESIYLPRIKIDLELKNINLNFTKKSFAIIKNLPETFKSETNSTLLSGLFKDKNDIIKHANSFGKIFRKNTLYNTWIEYYAFLSGNYLCFFKNLQQEQIDYYFYLNNAVLKLEEEINNQTGNLDSYTVLSNKLEKIEIKFANENKLKMWLNAIKERIYEIKTNHQNNLLNENKDDINSENINFGAKFSVKEFVLNLSDVHGNKEFVLTLSGIGLNIISKAREQELNFIIESLKLDSDHNLFNQKCLITSNNSFELMSDNSNLIMINVYFKDPKSKNYHNTNLDIQVVLANVTCYWHQDLMRNLINYFISEKSERLNISKIHDNSNLYNELSNDTEEISHNCLNDKSIIIKFTLALNNLNLICLHKSLNILFTEFSLTQAEVVVDYFIDHFEGNMKVRNPIVYDLSNYPYQYIMSECGNLSNPKRNKIFEFSNNSELTLNFKMYEKACPFWDNLFNSEIKIYMNSFKLYYYQEQIFRLYDYIFDDLINSVNPSKENKTLLKANSSFLNKTLQEMNFIKLEINVDNPQIILKSRPNDPEFFLIDLGKISMKNSFNLEAGKVRLNKEVKSWVSCLDVEIRRFNITRDDKFDILEPIDFGLVMCTLADIQENNNMTIIELDKSMQFALRFDNINVNSRQKDFKYLMRCLDLNINYTDEQNQWYKNSNIRTADTENDSKYDSFFLKVVKIIFNNITFNLYLEERRFCQLILLETYVEFYQCLSLRTDTDISVRMFSFIQMLNDDLSNMVIYSSGESSNNNMLNNDHKKLLKMSVYYRPNIDITTMVYMKELKLFIRYDILLLIKDFFLNGFPIYNPLSPDLPNKYDINRDNPCELKFVFEINEFLITFVTDKLENDNQEVLCFSSNFIVNYRKEKMKIIKQKAEKSVKDTLLLIELAEIPEEKIKASKILGETKSNLAKTNLIINNIKAFAFNIKELKKKDFKPKRMMLEEGIVNIDYNINLKYLTKNSFILSSEVLVELKDINCKLSYKDLHSVLSSMQYSYNLQNRNYEINKDFLTNKGDIHENSKACPNKTTGEIDKKIIEESNEIMTNDHVETDIIIDNNFYSFEFQTKSVKIVLIDNHSYSYYPFLKISLKNCLFNIEITSLTRSLGNLELLFKVSSHNYIAEVWEPILERNELKISYLKDLTDPYNPMYNLSIDLPSNKNNFLGATNINISDMSIAFLYTTFKIWIDKYKKFQNNENFKIDNSIINSDDNMKFSNHKIINVTGKKLKIYKNYYMKEINQIVKNFNYLTDLLPGESFDLEVNDNQSNKINKTNNLENSIFFELEDISSDRISDNVIKINEVQIKSHKIDYSILKNNPRFPQKIKQFEYIYSKVKYENIKKEIYFYSPLLIENETVHLIQLKITRVYYEELFIILEPKQKYGIPIEYYDGELDLSFCKGEPLRFSLSKLFNYNLDEYIEIKPKRGSIILNVFVREFDKNYENFKVLTINTSYKVRNCLPYPIEMITLGSIKSEKLNMEKDQILSFDNLSLKEDLIVYLKFLNFFSPKEILLCKAKKDKKTKEFEIIDSNNSTLLTLYCMTIEEKGCRMIVIYSNGLIIDNTLLNLSFYYKDKEKYKIRSSNNGNIFLFHHTDQIIVKADNIMSKPYSVKGIGLNTLIEMKDNKHNYQCSMQSSFSLVAKDLEIYCLILNFNPLYVIENKLKLNLLISFSDDKSLIDMYSYMDRRPFYFFGHGYEKKISFRPIEIKNNYKKDISIWNWSEGIILSKKNFTTISFSGVYPLDKKYINLHKRVENSVNLICIEETDYINSEFIIENRSSNVSVQIWQTSFKENKSDYVDVHSKCMFALNDSFKNNSIEMNFLFGKVSNRPILFRNSSVKIEFNEEKVLIDNKEEFYYPAKKVIKLSRGNYKYSGSAICLELSFDGTRKSIVVSDIIYDITKLSSNIFSITEFNIKIDCLGVAIIADNRNTLMRNIKTYKRYEIFYFFFKEIIYFSRYEESDKSYKGEVQFMIKTLQIDNQFNKITRYPVVVRPLTIKSNDNKIDIPFVFNLGIYLSKKKHENLTQISLLNFLLQTLVVSIDTDIIDSVIDFIQSITIQIKQPFLTISPIFSRDSYISNELKMTNNYIEPNWLYFKSQSIDKSLDGEKIFVQKLMTSPIDITFSISTKGKSNKFSQIITGNPVLSHLLSSFSDMDNVGLELAGAELLNVYTDKDQLFNLILDEYKQSLLHQIMRFVGSIDLLGNPVNLMKNIGTGFKDLIEKPANGFVKGPLQGFKGILAGSGSLAQKAVGGVFDTASKLTGGISKGLLSLTKDDNYIKEREDNKVSMKPGNVITGVGFGMFSVFSGIYHGVTGVVTKPIEAAKQGNIGKGFLQGFSGLIMKPISGVLDLVSKTTEGVKNTINSNVSIEKMRPSRAFYGKYLIFREFHNFHADVYMILKDSLDYSYVDFCDAIIYYNKNNEYSLVIVNKSEIIFYDLGKSKLKANVNFANITNIRIEGKVVKIFTLEDNKKPLVYHIELLDANSANLNTICELVTKYWKDYNTELF